RSPRPLRYRRRRWLHAWQCPPGCGDGGCRCTASALPHAVAWPPVPPACGKGLPPPAAASGSAGTPRRIPAAAVAAPAAPAPAVVPGHPEPPPLGSPLIREPERTRSQGRGVGSQPVRWPRRGWAAARSAARAGAGPARASRSPYGRCLLATVCTVAHHVWDDTAYGDIGDGGTITNSHTPGWGNPAVWSVWYRSRIPGLSVGPYRASCTI